MVANIPDDLLKTIRSCSSLPSAPAVVLQILDLVQDPEISIPKLGRVIARDPALVAKILKVANSAWCGVRHEIATLDQAINLLGLNGIMSLALSFSLVQKLRNIKEKAFDYQAYWRRSVIAASATLAVGSSLKESSRDELFLAGLLQDIGMLVIGGAVPDYGRLIDSANNEHERIVELERQELGTDHAQIGSWFLAQWGLPNILVEAVHASHNMEASTIFLAKSAAIGSRIADIWINPDTDSATASASEAFTSYLGLSPEKLDPILVKTAEDIPEITQNLDIAIDDAASIARLLDQARQALADLHLRTIQEARFLSIQVQRDTLTSLYNRAYLNDALENLFLSSQTLSQPLTVIFLDIDRFKEINDTYGHQGGDAVLVSVSRAIQSATRSGDTVTRFGGDEFIVLLDNTEESLGGKIAERIRASIAKAPHSIGDGKVINVTVSVGWTTMTPDSNISSAQELLDIADASLYAAKASGRNKISQAS
ncbi:MAG: GGDEF domain-containing protein [Acidobacteria bacterium]|nr:GGDEF domain-containing protein [Acidobacteriota bacterium]